MYELLLKNIKDNNLEHKIIPFNKGVFCYEGEGKMNHKDLDGGDGDVYKRYNEESDLPCNFGGISLGKDGEKINLTIIDNMEIEDIGYIHCDAQGSENFIFSKSIEKITKERPVIYYENNYEKCKFLFLNVAMSYPEYFYESMFNVKYYCMIKLGYSQCIESFNNSIDDLLIP